MLDFGTRKFTINPLQQRPGRNSPKSLLAVTPGSVIVLRRSRPKASVRARSGDCDVFRFNRGELVRLRRLESQGSLVVDTNGDLIGVATSGGADGDGAIFEFQNTGAGVASTPTLLASFDGSDGSSPRGFVYTDASGSLYGVTSTGGANGDGAIFELASTGTTTASSYASAPTLLASFSGDDGSSPIGGLIADSNGDLFGATSAGGANGDGAVFELGNTGTAAAPTYASTPTLIASFGGADTTGASPAGALIADANGDLFGVTSTGGTNGDGAVFELVNTGTAAAPTYASTPTLIASFSGANGASPQGGLVADANGDLFGVTSAGGANGGGAVFELANSGSVSAPSYASSPTTILSFDGTDGATPTGGLIVNSSGDLFGVTSAGGANGNGVVFELENTGTASAPSYASTPSVFESFDATNGSTPLAGLVAGPNGQLYGVTNSGGADGDGAAFEVSTSSITPGTHEFLDFAWLAQLFQGGLHGWTAELAELMVAFNVESVQTNPGFIYTGASTGFGAASTALSTASMSGASAFPTLTTNAGGTQTSQSGSA